MAKTKKVSLTIDDTPIQVAAGTTIMEAAEAFYGHATHTMVRKKAG